MILPAALALLLTASPASGGAPGAPLADDAPVHLGVALRVPNPGALQDFLTALQDPASPGYRAYLTPSAFGERFGLPAERFERWVSFFRDAGFRVTPYPNRTFLEAQGTAAQARALLGVQLRFSDGPKRYRTYDGALSLPKDLAPDLLHIAGLDTRIRHRHHLTVDYQGQSTQVMGAADFRLQYDMASLLSGGHAAEGLTTVVLATQEGTSPPAPDGGYGNPGPPFIAPSTQAIGAYFSTISDATATYTPVVMDNTDDDYDYPGSNQEYELDVEMQSVGAPNAASIDMLLTPASEVFETGAEYAVNMLSDAVVVSTSIGLCEPEEAEYAGGPPGTDGGEPTVMQQAVQQGVAEGQTWFAAAGDTGADDCNDSESGTGNGFGGGNATVDFPGSMPEIVDMGGTELFGNPDWSSSGALLAISPEVVWNEGAAGGAAGGGQSEFYAKPSWQVGVGPEKTDNARDVPDISLMSSPDYPGVAVYECGAGQDFTCQGELTGAGSIDIIGGTSVASPLAAGMFAALSGQLGCRLGDVHPALYALGRAQDDGGAAVYTDITSGNTNFPDPAGTSITGFTAGPGFDLASGWGTLDLGQLAAHWPACTPTTTATASSSSSSGSAAGSTGTSGSSSGGVAGASTSSSGIAITVGSTGSGAGSTGTAAAATSSSGHVAAAGSTAGSSGTAGVTSTGTSTGGTTSHPGTTLGSTGSTSSSGSSGGCGCSTPGAGLDSALWMVLAAGGIRRRRQST